MPARLFSARRQYGPPAWPPFEKLQARLEQWQREHPQLLNLRILGKTAEGRPLFAAILTDPTGPEEFKEHVLVTTLHSGLEHCGTTSVFYLMNWLLSGDPQASEMLRRQVVVCVPIGNPDAYVAGTFKNTQGFDPYLDWTLSGPKNPEKMPEAVAVQRMMDEYQPELHADLHGASLDFEGQIFAETSGAAYSNVSLRSYHREIRRLMDEAALKEGYPTDMLEEDAEQIFWGPELDSIREKLWGGRPRPYAAIYAYNRYHTLPLANENVWERAAYLRHRRLLEIGNETWPGEYYPGYPTRVIKWNELHLVTAYGETAARRRRSRVELWNKQRQFVPCMNMPETEGMVLFICTTSADAGAKWLPERTIKGFLARIARHPRLDSQAVARLLEGHPEAAEGRPPRLETEFARPLEGNAPIEHGLALRLRMPYMRARITEVRWNGHQLRRSETDGYLTWVARGFTYVQVNIPPETTKKEDLHVVTCLYDPGEKRIQGDW